MNILLLCHEQRRHYSLEPGFFEVVLPLSKASEVNIYSYPYQRLMKTHDESIETSLDTLFKDIKTICELFKPDLILNLLTWHNECLPAEILYKIRENCCNALITIYFDHDETNEKMLEGKKSIFEASKLNLFADSPLRVKRKFSKIGPYAEWKSTNSAIFKPLPIDSSIFKILPKPIARVGLMGSLEGHRIFIKNSLESKIDFLYTGGSLLSESFQLLTDYAFQLSNSLANIVTSTLTYRSQTKGRSFQIISCGSCLLEQENEDNKYFLNNEFILFWNNIDELISSIEDIMISPNSSLEKAREYTELIKPITEPTGWLNSDVGIVL